MRDVVHEIGNSSFHVFSDRAAWSLVLFALSSDSSNEQRVGPQRPMSYPKNEKTEDFEREMEGEVQMTTEPNHCSVAAGAFLANYMPGSHGSVNLIRETVL